MEIRDVLPPDAIPSVDDPAFGPEYFGDPDDAVIALSADPPRAYPVRVLHYHEIVNDDLATGAAPGADPGDGAARNQPRESDPVAVTWCPLCGSAVVYDRRVEGRTLTFGVSGKLADDDLVMYDRETGSEWKQSTGECIAGSFEGTDLTVRPAATTTWDRFRADHPDGVVLQPPGTESEAASDDDTPAPVDYDVTPYERYFAGEGFGLAAHRGEGGGRSWDREDLDPKTVVLGVERDGEAVGFPFSDVRAAGGVVRATVGDSEIVVFVVDDDLHAYAAPVFSFEGTTVNENADDGESVVRGDGTRWDPATGRAEDGRTLDRLPARRMFAFTWQDDHGPDAFWSAGRA